MLVVRRGFSGDNQAVTSPLRVAMTLEQFWHRVPGGTAVATLGMARALATHAELELVGVTASHRGPQVLDEEIPMPIRRLPLPRVALYEAWHRLRAPKVQRATGDVDLIHATTIAMPPRSAPLVMTMHDLAWRHEPAHFTKRGIAFFERGLSLALREADLVMCPSRTTLADCERNGFETERLRHVPMGTEVAPVSPVTVTEILEAHRLPRGYILWSGTIEPRKNLPRLLAAFRKLDSELPLVVAGPRGWNEDIDRLIADVRDRVKLVGFVSRRELAALYAGARVFCFPSLLEGFGLPVLEAMAQGTPVVTSRGTSTEELAEGAGVLVDPRDVDSIRNGIQSVLDDPSLAERLSAAGPKRAAEYSWERTAGLVASVYKEVAA